LIPLSSPMGSCDGCTTCVIVLVVSVSPFGISPCSCDGAFWDILFVYACEENMPSWENGIRFLYAPFRFSVLIIVQCS
jgi:hypothetical protein